MDGEVLPPGTPASFDSQVNRQQALDELEQQVAQAQSELEEYQHMLNDLPAIYEGKFRQKVHTVAQNIRQLLDERRALRDLVAKALVQARENPLLPAVKEENTTASVSVASQKKWSDLHLPRFRILFSPVAALKAKRASLQFLGLRFGILFLIFFAGVQILGKRTIAPTPRQVSSVRVSDTLLPPASLKIQASGGQSWVLVEDLKGRMVLDVILEPGQSKFLSIKSGLRVRSGRPDLLMIEVDKTAAKPLGKVTDMDWFYFRQ